MMWWSWIIIFCGGYSHRGQLLLWLSPPSEFSVLRPQLAPLVVMVVKCFDAPTLASRHD
ncbi:unnamed protein product [Brassica rapa subsp. trilocularis]